MTELPFHPEEQQAIGASGPGSLMPTPSKEFTGARMDVAVREAIIAKKAAGLTNTEIARDLGLSRNTVSAEIRRAEKDGRLGESKQRMAEKLMDLAEEHLDLKLRNPGKMSALDFAIYVDKGQLLAGSPTQIVGVSRKEDEGAVLDQLTKLSQGIIDIDATVIDPACLPPPTPPTTS